MLKRKNIVKMLGMGSICLFLLGCTGESFLVQEEDVILEHESLLDESQELSVLESENTQETPENDENQTGSSVVSEESQNAENKIAVHICGAVNQPGVYYLKENQRLYEGIQKAGGFRPGADQEYLNQASILEDGMKIVVPTKEEVQEGLIQEENSFITNPAENASGKVDLNTADVALHYPELGKAGQRVLLPIVRNMERLKHRKIL